MNAIRATDRVLMHDQAGQKTLTTDQHGFPLIVEQSVFVRANPWLKLFARCRHAIRG